MDKAGTCVGDWIRKVNAAAESSRLEPGDYLDNEGFVVCGKCHTRRQTIIKVPDLNTPGEIVSMKVNVICDCRKKQEEERKEQERKMKELEVISSLKKQSLMDERLHDASFSIFRATEENAWNLKLCKRFVKHFDEMLEKNQGLLFYGGVGTGKTFAAACIANYLLEHKVSVVMTSFVKLINSMSGFADEDEAVISKLNRAKLLIIDDLGAERGTDFALEKVYNIIDSRYRAELPVILTTNLTLEEMKETTDARYSRIYDRVFEMCYPMKFSGRSWRKAAAARRFTEMEKFLEGNDG